MYRTRTTERVYRWRDMIFMELSETIILFYKRLNIDITNTTSGGSDKYSINNEKIIILFNYNKKPIGMTSTQSYIDMIEKSSMGTNFFYILTYIGQKKIIDIDDLKSTLTSLTKHKHIHKQKQATLKLTGDAGIVKLLKIKLN